MCTKFWSENLKGRNYLEDLVIDGRIILKRDHRDISCGVVKWIHVAQGWGPEAGFCEYGNEPLGLIKRGEFLD
jgi:hypothetical protein